MLSRLAVALVHYPVLNRCNEVVASAVTNLDLHDIARTCRTFGVGRFFVVTPVKEQQKVVEQILEHWLHGYGSTHNPDRCSAFQLLETVTDLETARERWSKKHSRPARIIVTSAKSPQGLNGQDCQRLLIEEPLLLVLGTGSGLAPEIIERSFETFQSIQGVADYNHLPVRAAAAIILDRIFTGR
ncbi:MAG: hypothetical protein CVU69_12365 [Deltaproteobacteria bacterium HGW-Deltaproteobacteria-4]|nr:MAG: hypothetical protein CVU69_12365 [Deltaproteobacteria bacterium HGW-Deltaproteobacteria-4]